jgi:hypothetical protein
LLEGCHGSFDMRAWPALFEGFYEEFDVRFV